MKFKKLITLASLVGLIVFLATTVVACGTKSENTETKTAQVEKNKEKEKKEALDKAKSYDKSLNLSYNAMEKKLLEEDFSEEAIKYALNNVGIDWKEIALERAKELKQSAPEPDFAISDTRDGLQSEQFRDEEVKYAMDNLKK